MKYCLLYLLFFAIVLSFSCSDKGSPTTTVDLPVKTIYYVVDSTGYWHFYTNDTAYCNPTGGKGYFHINDSVYTPFDSVETEVIKNSGSSYMYGIVFCYHDNGETYRLLIGTSGAYELLKYVGGVNSWYNFNTDAWSLTNAFTYPTSSHLHKGYGSSNKIKVVRTGSGNFDLYFNSIKSDSFNDGSFTSGKTGFASYVGPKSEEYFPNNPVDILYKEIIAN